MTFYKPANFAVVVPMANEATDFAPFIDVLQEVLNGLESGTVYLVVDRASTDNTPELCRELSARDGRFVTVWAPQNKNVVDAYIAGYREALKNHHNFIIEMDAGMSHDPRALPMFLRVLNEGNECAFGSRFINGGSIWGSNWRRTFLSKGGTRLSNLLLGTNMRDTTSGYQGFHRAIVEEFAYLPLRSTAHFYQTELRYLLRKKKFMEVPIHYRAPSPSVSKKAIKNAMYTLIYYVWNRIKA